MSNNKLPAIEVARKTGSEHFHSSGRSLGLDVLSFWSWTASDLAANNLRGHLAEFLVAVDLGLHEGTRCEWDAYDLRTSSGVRIEVKSASYIQTWEQEKLSNIQFDIKQAKDWDHEKQQRTSTYQRNSDVYVFCLQKNKDTETFDPTDLSQWTFFVLGTHILNDKCGNQKKISLNPLLGLNPIKCAFGEIRRNVEVALNRSL